MSTTLITEPIFCLHNAAAPQRNRPMIFQLNLNRISDPGLMESKFQYYDDSYVNKSKSISVDTIINKSDIQLSNPRTSLNNIEPQVEDMSSTQPIQSNVEENKSTKHQTSPSSKKSLIKLLRKVLLLLPKKESTKKTMNKKSIRNKASCLFDEDDGIIDDNDAKVGTIFVEGGLPFDLVNSNLRSTYVNSLKKLKLQNKRPLHQIMMINSIVSKLKVQVDKCIPEGSFDSSYNENEYLSKFPSNFGNKNQILRHRPRPRSSPTRREVKSEGDLSNVEIIIQSKNRNRLSNPIP